MKTKLRSLNAALTVCLLLLAAPSMAAEEGYPEPITTMEKMRLAKPMRIQLPTATTRKAKETRTVVIVAHVAKDGRVLKSKIHEPSGAHHVDEAVLLAMRDVEFLPYTVDGQPAEVSVVIPVHLSADDIRRGR